MSSLGSGEAQGAQGDVIFQNWGQRAGHLAFAGLAILGIAAVFAGLAVSIWPGILNLDTMVSGLGIVIALAWLGLAAIGFSVIAKLPTGKSIPLILMMALAVRLASHALLGGASQDAGSDPGAYLEIANNILVGDGFVTGQFRALFPPLYPLLLAGIGPSSLGVLVLNSTIDIAAAGTILLIAGDRRTGLAAAWLYLVWPSFILGATVPQKDTLSILLALQIVLGLVRQTSGFRWKETTRIGLSTGLLGLTQPAILPFAIFAGLVMLPSYGIKRMTKTAVAALPFVLLVMLPWWARNWAVLDTFVPLTSASGYSTLVAATGRYDSLAPALALPEIEGSKLAANLAWQVISASPWEFITNRITGMGQALALENASATRLLWTDLPKSIVPAFAPVTQLSYALALIAAAWAALRRPLSQAHSMLLAAFLHIAIFGLWFEFAERHRYFMLPFVFLLAVSIFTRRSERQT